MSILSDEGIALALRQKGIKGVFLIPEIDVAINCGYWKETPNDKLPDVKTLMVAPVNGWDGENKVMLGILYVTSRNNPFVARHTLPLKAFADILGLAYPSLLTRRLMATEAGEPNQ